MIAIIIAALADRGHVKENIAMLLAFLALNAVLGIFGAVILPAALDLLKGAS